MTTLRKTYLFCILWGLTALVLAGCQSAAKTTDVEIVSQGNISYPKTIEKPLLKAYRHFPQLRSNNIYFEFNTKFKAAFMQAQPVFSSLGRSKGSREYIIRMKPYFVIHNDTIPIQEVPDDVLTGWLGHEMGHIMDYRERSSLNLTLLGLQYLLSPNTVIIAEKDADVFAIKAGLAKEIIATKDFILHGEEFPEWYRERIQKFYLTPDDVREYARKEGITLDKSES